MLSLPSWIKPHLLAGKNFDDLTEQEKETIRQRVTNFKADKPEVSVMIPAWNEANNIYRTISSLTASNTAKKVEIVVINNNSTDRTQQVLDELGVRNYMQTIQGTPYARQMGLDKARGKYHLCADADTFYPPQWIDLMVAPMEKDEKVSGVYGRHSFIPPNEGGRLGLLFYEWMAGVMVRVRKRRREYLNVFGFNMGFVTERGRSGGGFHVKGKRVYDNVSGSDYLNEAEDGRMALNLQKSGILKIVSNKNAIVFTSPRRLLDDGSIGKAFVNRAKVQISNMKEYISGKKVQ